MLTILIVLIGALGIALILPIFKAYRFYKHDVVAFEFKKLQNDMVIFMCDNIDNTAIPKQEILAINQLLHKVSDLSNRLDDLKQNMFNYKVLSMLIESAPSKDKIQLTKGEYIDQFYKRLSMCLYSAFFTFIPVLRFRLLLKITYYFCKLLMIFGINQCIEYIQVISKSFRYFNENKYTQGQTLQLISIRDSKFLL